MSAVETARVGDILQLERHGVEIEPDGNYRRIGIYSWGKGFLHRPAVPGAEMGSLRYFTFPRSSLVMSNIQAWEAALAVAGEAEEGMVASNRFLPYVPVRDNSVDLDYLKHYFLSDPGLAQLRRASPGTQVRNRTLGKKLFEDLFVPLPPLPDQRRIAAHLDSVAQQANGVQSVAARSAAAVQASIGTALGGVEPIRRLGDLVEVNPRPVRVQGDDEVAFVPMAAVSDVTGSIDGAEVRLKSDLTSGYKQFCDGDLIFARITPCMQNGKTAIYRSADRPVAFGSTEFHVLRGDAEVLAWVHQVLRTTWFIEKAEVAFTGTAGQQRVPAGFLQTVDMPMPLDLASATAELKRLAECVVQIGAVDGRRKALAGSLLPAARNEVFSALR